MAASSPRWVTSGASARCKDSPFVPVIASSDTCSFMKSVTAIRVSPVWTSRTVRTMEQVTEVRELAHQGKGPVFALVKINPEALVFTLPPADGVILTTRFRQSVLGDQALYN